MYIYIYIYNYYYYYSNYKYTYTSHNQYYISKLQLQLQYQAQTQAQAMHKTNTHALNKLEIIQLLFEFHMHITTPYHSVQSLRYESICPEVIERASTFASSISSSVTYFLGLG